MDFFFFLSQIHESRRVVAISWGRGWGDWGDVGHRVPNFSCMGYIDSRDVIHTMVTMVKNIVMDT